MNPRWLISRAVREAADLRRQVRVVLESQRDLLSPRAIAEVTRALGEFAPALWEARNDAALSEAAGKLEKCATQWLKPYPHAGARENLKEFLVSGVLVLTVFTFFLQPMKIPSGSAQPTLYGNVVTNLKERTDLAVPAWWGRVVDWFRGLDYHVWVAPEDGEVRLEPVTTVAGFLKRQRFVLGDYRDTFTIWFPPEHLDRDCGVASYQRFRKGETILRMQIRSGDRLFVDRFTYNFRRPTRGETIVFVSTGIPKLIQDTHYIKRLIGLSNDHVRIGNDRHVLINGARLDAATPHFENVYGFRGPPRESVYSGHVNETVASEFGRGSLAPLFPDEQTEFVVGPNRYLPFGDNTMNSFDGRAWGDFPREKVIGKACFVFWPLTSRFGLADR